MKFYHVVIYTLSTVSLIHCSQESNQNENNSAAYHIEFEDKSIHGGYGYKLQVAGKTKYQESWKNDKKTASVETSTPVETSDYTTSGNNFQYKTNSLKKVENNNNIVQDNFLDSSVKISNAANNEFKSHNQYSSKPIIGASSQNVASFSDHQEKTPLYSNEKNTYFGKNVYNSPINTPDDSQVLLNAQSSHVTPNYEFGNSNKQYISNSGFVPSVQYSTKPSLEIATSNNFYGSADNGPQVFIESTSGKIAHNQYLNGYGSDTSNIVSSPGIDLSNQYLKTNNNYQYFSQNFANAQNDQHPNQYQQQLEYEPVNYSNLYNSQVPSATSSYLNNNQKNNYNTINYSTQYASQTPSHPEISEEVSYFKSNTDKSPNSSSSRIPAHISSFNQFVPESKVKYSPETSLSSYRSISHNSKPEYYPKTTFKNKPKISNNQHSTQIFTQYSSDSSHPSSLSNGYVSDVPSVNLGNNRLNQYVPTHYSSVINQPSSSSNSFVSDFGNDKLKTVDNTQQQNLPSLPVISSAQFPINYNQFFQKFSQENSFNSQGNDNTPLNFYNTESQPVHKKVVNYHYKQELPSTGNPTNEPTYSLNPLQNMNNIWNPYSSNNLGNMYGQILNLNNQQNAQNIGNNLYGVLQNENLNSYAHGLNYGYNTPNGNVPQLLNSSGFKNTGLNGYNGNLQLLNAYNNLRRSFNKVKSNHRVVVDQKSTE